MRASSGMIGHDPLADLRVADQIAQQTGEHHRRRDPVVLPPSNSLSTSSPGPAAARRGRRAAARTAERRAALEHVPDLIRVRARVEVRRVAELLVRDRQLEPVAEDPELVLAQLLRLVGDVAGLDPPAQGPALDGLGEDHRRRAGELGRRLVRGDRPCGSRGRRGGAEQLVVGQVLDELAEARVGAEELLADVDAGRDRSTSGTRRRPSCSSSRPGRRRRRAPAARPTRGPR